MPRPQCQRIAQFHPHGRPPGHEASVGSGDQASDIIRRVIRVGRLVEQLRAESHTIDDSTLALTTPLMRKHLNPFGRYHFDLDRMRQTGRPNR